MDFETLDNIDRIFLINLAKYLNKRSKEICIDNECTEDNHNCESYAYISYGYNENTIYCFRLLDICSSDFFQGFSNMDNPTVEYITLPLPFEGNEIELFKQIELEVLSNI